MDGTDAPWVLRVRANMTGNNMAQCVVRDCSKSSTLADVLRCAEAKGVSFARSLPITVLLSAALGPDKEADTLTVLGSSLLPPPPPSSSSASTSSSACTRSLSSAETLGELGVQNRDTLYITAELDHLKTIIRTLAGKGPSATVALGD